MSRSDHQTITYALSPEELAAARGVVLAAAPSETEPADGVALVIAHGTSRWTAWGPYVHAVTDPVERGGADDATILVSRRLIEFAAALADDGDDVVLHVHPDGVEVSGGAVVLGFARPAPRAVPAAPLEHHGPRAVVRATALFQLLSMGRTLPAGVDLDEVDAPPFALTIGDDRLTATIDWSPTGAPATFLAIDAATSGKATVDVGPAIVANVARLTDPDEDVTIVIPPAAPWIVVVAAGWSARIRCVSFSHDGAGEQLELPFWDTISCQGGLRPDPLPDASLTDVRAFAIDPHVEVRLRAAASRWNVDVRVQRVLASDDDEQVVLALLDHVDPYRDVVEAIIDGPHVSARRELAGRNLLTELLVRLAADADTETARQAQCTLDARVGRTTLVTAEVSR